MRNLRYAFVAMLMPLMLASCFSDDGNYEYESLKPPTWLDNFMDSPIQVLVYGGRPVRLDGSRYFNWGKLDSLQRSQEVRYEWRMNGKVYSTELKEEMTTDEFLKRMGLEEMPVKEQSGDFSIIEKSSGVTFKVKCTLFFKPAIGGGDFVVYSAMGPNMPNVGKLTVFRLNYLKEKGKLKENFEFGKYVVDNVPGTPRSLDVAVAKNVGAAGSLTLITEEGDAMVYNAGNLKKEWDLSSFYSASAIRQNCYRLCHKTLLGVGNATAYDSVNVWYSVIHNYFLLGSNFYVVLIYNCMRCRCTRCGCSEILQTLYATQTTKF